MNHCHTLQIFRNIDNFRLSNSYENLAFMTPEDLLMLYGYLQHPTFSQHYRTRLLKSEPNS